MGINEEFQKILNDTVAIVEQKDKNGLDEELLMRFESNIHALEILSRNITNEAARERAKSIISSFGKTETLMEKELNLEETDDEKGKEIIDQEIFSNTVKLRRMAEKFNKTLLKDKETMETMSGKMEGHILNTKENMNIMKKTQNGLTTSAYISLMLVFFVSTYFIIRFL